MLEQLAEMVEKLKSTTSRNDKVKILEDNEWSRDILGLIYNPHNMLGVTSKNCKKLSELESTNVSSDLISLISDVQETSGHDSIKLVNSFIKKNGFADLVYSVIDKNLKCRIDAKVINLAFPKLIPTFNVALAKNYSDHANYVDEDWFWSQKLDGVRLIVQKRGSNVTYWSRQGKSFTTLEALTPQLRAIEGDFVLDGEVCIVNNGVEDFQETMKVIRKKDYTIDNPKFFVFDILTTEEFDNESSTTILSDRLNRLSFTGNITKLEQHRIKDKDLFNYPKEWEGLILRKDTGYEGKRTKNLLKVKKFFDDEYEIKGIETGPYQVVENGRETEIETVTNVLIDHKGHEVSVGSGFSIDERKEFFRNPQNIIGTQMTVQHFGETQNKKGGLSLRFPTVKVLHGNARST